MASDREVLTTVLDEAGSMSASTAQLLVDAILASDWLRERDRQIAREVEALVREETKAGIAEAIKASLIPNAELVAHHLINDTFLCAADITREWEPGADS